MIVLAPKASLPVRVEDAKADLLSSDSDVRMQAVRDLISLRDPKQLDLLMEASNRESDVQIRYEIKKGIGILKNLQPPKPAIAGAETQATSGNLKKVEESLLSDDIEQVNKAFRYVSQYRLKQFLPLMQKISRERDSAYQRSLVIRFMQTIGGEQYFTEIVAYLGDEDPRVVSTAIEALEAIGNTKALAYLAQCVTHPHNRVQASAMKALYNLGDQTALNLFEKMVSSPHSEYRNSAAYALKEMKIEKGIPLLARLAKDEVESVRQKALDGLKAMADAGYTVASDLIKGDTSSLDTIVATNDTPLPPYPMGMTLETKLQWLRGIPADASDAFREEIILVLPQEHEDKAIASLIMALARFVHADSSEALIPFLGNRIDRIRANAVEALGTLLPPNSRDVLVPMLEDNNNRVIGNAILALYEHYRQISLKALRYLAESSNRNEQLTAVFCIGGLEADDCLNLSEYLLESQFSDVREKMLTVLERLSTDSAMAMRILKQNRLRMAMFEPQVEKVVPPAPTPAPDPAPVAVPQEAITPAVSLPPPPKPATVSASKKPPSVASAASSLPQQNKSMFDDLNWPSVYAFSASLGFLAFICVSRLLITSDSNFQNFVMTPIKSLLLGESIHWLLFYAVIPFLCILFLAANFEVLARIPFLTGFIAGLFLLLYIPSINYLKISSGQGFNFLGFYTAESWFNLYSFSYQLALMFLNLPFFFLPGILEGISFVKEQASKIMLSVMAFLCLTSILWLGALNSASYYELETRRIRNLESYLLTQLKQVRALEEKVRYEELGLDTKLATAQNPMEIRLAEIKLQEIRAERRRLRLSIFELEERLKKQGLTIKSP